MLNCKRTFYFRNITFAVLILFPLFICGQDPSSKNSLLSITSKRNKEYTEKPVEKLYLQFDKPYYATGDTLWFKGYLFKASYLTPSTKSSILYIDIANDSNKVVKRYRFKVQVGLCWGNIVLNDTEFPSGTYTLRAYTNWMCNWGDDEFFYRRFYISSAGENNWLVNSRFNVSVAGADQKISARLIFSDADRVPFAAKPIELQVMNGDKCLYRQTLQTSNSGSLDVTFNIPAKNKGITLVTENKQKDKKAVVPVILNRPENADVQFLPEGGSLVAGFPACIGFKATGENGKGINVSGIITDHEQKQVVAFQSMNRGMGSFDLIVKEGERYTAKVRLPGGLIKEYPLPVVKSAGTILQVRNSMVSDSVEVITGSTADFGQEASNYFLLGEARGVVCYAAVISFGQSNLVKHKIAKSLFPTGITHFILMTTNEQLLNERLIFIDHQDNLNIQITNDKPVYVSRDSIGLQLLVTDKAGNPVSAYFSMAITDDAQVKAETANNDNILTRLLLTSDLKGYVEEPGYYFNHGQTAWQALDNLMLTQGWVNHEPVNATMPYEAEEEFKVSGRVSNVFNKWIKSTRVMLLSKSPELIKDTLTDANGRFIFDHFPQIDTPVFVIQAVNKNGKSFNVRVNMDETLPPNFTRMPYPQMMPWYVNSDTTLLSLAKNDARAKELQYFPESGHILNEVKITAKKVIKDSYNLNGPGAADQVIDEKELESAGKKTIFDVLTEKVVGFGEGSLSGHNWFRVKYKWAFIIIDGTPVSYVVDITDFNYFRRYLQLHTAEDIKGIEVIFADRYTAKYETIYHHRPGVVCYIEITTRSGHGPLIDSTPGFYLYKSLPFTSSAQFYKPRYLVADTSKYSTDLRSTIDWEPNLTTDINGKGRVSFYAADRSATYTITINGTDMMGNLGFQTKKIYINRAREQTK